VLPRRFEEKFERQPDGCWVWTAAKHRGGYGAFWAGKRVLAHRFAYEVMVAPIPRGLQLDHLCRNRACVNPAHLEPVTQCENEARGVKGALTTHCPKGHPYSGDNLILEKKHGWRKCRECHRERRRVQPALKEAK
jgi:hypothetical protein